jgi:hypothetical protein
MKSKGDKLFSYTDSKTIDYDETIIRRYNKNKINNETIYSKNSYNSENTLYLIGKK